jgi:hypothetical protein
MKSPIIIDKRSELFEGSEKCDVAPSDFHGRCVVFSVHGIRTNGGWQSVLADVMERSGIQVRSFSYGNFGLSRFIFSGARRRIAEEFSVWFELQVKELGLEDLRDPELRPSVVAHSFGALVVALALRECVGLKINKLILSGSIVPCDFEWDALMKRGQVEAVRNEISLRDFWPELVRHLVSDTGASGRHGFAIVGRRLHNQRYSGYGHCDYLTRLHFETSWLPFLRNKSVS